MKNYPTASLSLTLKVIILPPGLRQKKIDKSTSFYSCFVRFVSMSFTRITLKIYRGQLFYVH